MDLNLPEIRALLFSDQANLTVYVSLFGRPNICLLVWINQENSWTHCRLFCLTVQISASEIMSDGIYLDGTDELAAALENLLWSYHSREESVSKTSMCPRLQVPDFSIELQRDKWSLLKVLRKLHLSPKGLMRKPRMQLGKMFYFVKLLEINLSYLLHILSMAMKLSITLASSLDTQLLRYSVKNCLFRVRNPCPIIKVTHLCRNFINCSSYLGSDIRWWITIRIQIYYSTTYMWHASARL